MKLLENGCLRIAVMLFLTRVVENNLERLLARVVGNELLAIIIDNRFERLLTKITFWLE